MCMCVCVDVAIKTEWLLLSNSPFSEKIRCSSPCLTLSVLRNFHACFISKYMYVCIYERVGVRWSWHLVVINKWSALPSALDGDSQSPSRLMHFNFISPAKNLNENGFVPILSGLVRCSLVCSGSVTSPTRKEKRVTTLYPCYVVESKAHYHMVGVQK